ncbi:MAG: hypothetical protein ACXWIW_06745 [Croceibacterium sp.]
MGRLRALLGLNNPLDQLDLENIFPTQEALNEDVVLNRSFAADMAEDQRATLASVRDATTDLAKWILTTLLAINAGALVGLSQLAISPAPKIAAATFLIVGLLLPLFSAHLSVRAGLELSLPIGEAQGYWRTVRHNGYRVRETELAQVGIATRALAASKWPYRLGYASIGCFIIGVAIVAFGLVAGHPDNVAGDGKKGAALHLSHVIMAPATAAPAAASAAQ